MKTVRKLLTPLVFLAAGGVGVGLIVAFVDVAKAISWINDKTGIVIPWMAQKEDASGYVAVYLAGGKVYFGKLVDVRSESPSLTDVFFLSVTQQSPPSAAESPDEAEGATVEPAQQLDYELVKLTDQLQKPSDKLILSRDQILFWEPLRKDSRVVQAIKKYHEQQDR